MANTYTLIEAKTLSSTTASITFASIPQTYTDLIIQVSARSTEVDTASSLRIRFNSDSANVAATELRGIDTTVASYQTSLAQVGYVAVDQSQASTFGSGTIYVPNYTGSNTKSSSGDIAQVSNTAGNNFVVLNARLWSVTDAITSVTVAPGLGSWVSNSNFYLYGIKNS